MSLTNKKTLSLRRKFLRQDNQKYGAFLQPVLPADWPSKITDVIRFGVWRSKRFLVQGFKESAGVIRLSICRTELDSKGQWKDGIAWEELQQIKDECGFGNHTAVEIFPAEEDVVNVANMRHLWVLPEKPSYCWRNGK